VVFRDRLIATIRAARPVLETDAASTLVVSQDLDVGVPVSQHGALRERLGRPA
jgi:hypothetical protein